MLSLSSLSTKDSFALLVLGALAKRKYLIEIDRQKRNSQYGMSTQSRCMALTTILNQEAFHMDIFSLLHYSSILFLETWKMYEEMKKNNKKVCNCSQYGIRTHVNAVKVRDTNHYTNQDASHWYKTWKESNDMIPLSLQLDYFWYFFFDK